MTERATQKVKKTRGLSCRREAVHVTLCVVENFAKFQRRVLEIWVLGHSRSWK